MTAEDVAREVNLSVAAIRSYERGQRHPPVMILEKILNVFGRTLAAAPLHPQAIRVREDVVADLRAIADQLEGLESVRVIR